MIRIPSRAAILAILMLLTSVLPITAASASAGATYRFSIVPGTAAWATLKTHKEMEAATQIPQPEAAAMTTDELVDLALRYPLMSDALAFNSVQHGFEVVTSRFNGLSELLSRPDAGAALLRRYRVAPVAVTGDQTGLQAGQRAFRLWQLEMLLAQPQVLAKMPPAQLEAVMRAGETTFAAKQANSIVYAEAGLEPTATLLGRALATREGWHWSGSGLLSDAIALVPGSPQAVLAAVRRHFADPANAHPIQSDQQAVQAAGLGISPMDYSGTVTTPRGTSVAVIVMTTELSAAVIADYNNRVATQYPLATRETNSSRKYNCHSYAWHSSSTANDKWMNTPGDNKYWEDGSYTFWHPPYIWFSDMKISWGQDDHSARWVGTGNSVRSKWGQWPRMLHTRDYTPYNEGSAPPPYTIGQGLNTFFLT